MGKARRHGGTEARRTVVVGAGVNGLTAACVLAGAGRAVTIVERRAVVGGMSASEEFHPGYRAPGLFHDTTGLLPEVREMLVREACLELATATPATLLPEEDGRGLLLSDDPADAAAELSRRSPRDAEQYAAFRAFLRTLRPFVHEVISRPPPELDPRTVGDWMDLARTGWSLRRLGRHETTEVLRILPMCVADWLGEWFEGEALRSLLAAPALDGTWTGPWSPGTNANLVLRESMRGPAARGGPGAVVAALRSLAERRGAEIRTECEVTSIRTGDRGVAGVQLATGETIDAEAVLLTCDPKHGMLDLVPDGAVPDALVRHVEELRTRGTTAKVNLAVSRPLRFACRPDHDVQWARVGERIDDLERAFDPVKYGRFTESPILDVHVPTHADPAGGPEGHHVVSVVAHFAPHALRAGWDDEQREALGEAVVATLARYAPELPGSIVARETLTPADIETRYGTTGGHIHHGEHALDQLIVRPAPDCHRYATPLPGLYLAGSGSHPGGGLTGAPGWNAANLITG